MTMTSSVAQVTAHMGLRAPRAVLVVPGWDDWRSMAREGIHETTTVWGGAGFVVVPVASADVHPAVVAALRAYDPDCVAVPSFIADDDRQVFYQAQTAISTACSNYRAPMETGTSVASPTVGELWAPHFERRGEFTALTDVLQTSPGDVTIGANPALGGSLGVCAAARWGLAEPPSSEPADIDPQLRIRAILQLVSYSSDLKYLHGVSTRDFAIRDFLTDFDRTLFGLSGMYELGGDAPPVLVLGGWPGRLRARDGLGSNLWSRRLGA